MINKILTRLKGADRHSKEVLRGSSIAIIVKVLAGGSMFGMNLVIARQLGAAESGLFFLAYSIIFIAAAISRLGLDETFVRFMASHQATEDSAQINALFRSGIRWSLIASLIVATLFWLFADTLANHVFNLPTFADVIRVMSLGIPFMALFILYAKALQGIKRIPQSTIVFSVSAPLILLVLALLLGPQKTTTVGWLFVLASGLTWILGAFWWSKRSNKETTAARIDRSEILASCIPLLGIAILVQVTFWASQIILGVWASSTEIAIFNAAQRTAMLISLVLAAVNSIAAPKFAELYRLKQYDSLRQTSYHVTRLMITFALFPLALMLFFPQQVLQLFGPEFSAGATGMRILAVAQFINVATGSVSFLLSMTGHEKLLRRNVLISAILTIALGLGLIPGYGMTGAAIATATGIATNNLLGMWQVRRIHGFNTLAIWR